MAQLSKFIPKGATVLSGTGSAEDEDGGIQSVATLNPYGTRTVVILNTYHNAVYLTSTTSNCQKWSGNIPTESVVTWVLPAV